MSKSNRTGAAKKKKKEKSVLLWTDEKVRKYIICNCAECLTVCQAYSICIIFMDWMRIRGERERGWGCTNPNVILWYYCLAKDYSKLMQCSSCECHFTTFIRSIIGSLRLDTVRGVHQRRPSLLLCDCQKFPKVLVHLDRILNLIYILLSVRKQKVNKKTDPNEEFID